MDFRIAQRIVIIASFTLVGAVLSNQFVVQKKTKLPSTHKLKEQCCEQYARIIQLIPGVMHSTADLQTIAFDILQRYCEGDAACLGSDLTKEQLVTYNTLLNKMANVCENFTTEITQLLKQIHAIKTV